MWIVSARTIGSRGQLTTSGKPVGHETLEEDRLEIGPGQVDGGSVSCRSRADDDLGKKDDQKSTRESGGREILQLWSASLSSSRFFR